MGHLPCSCYTSCGILDCCNASNWMQLFACFVHRHPPPSRNGRPQAMCTCHLMSKSNRDVQLRAISSPHLHTSNLVPTHHKCFTMSGCGIHLVGGGQMDIVLANVPASSCGFKLSTASLDSVRLTTMASYVAFAPRFYVWRSSHCPTVLIFQREKMHYLAPNKESR